MSSGASPSAPVTRRAIAFTVKSRRGEVGLHLVGEGHLGLAGVGRVGLGPVGGDLEHGVAAA